MSAWRAWTISPSRSNEAQTDPRVRRHRLLRVGRAAGPADGRGRVGRALAEVFPAGGTARGRRAGPTPVCTRSARWRASRSREDRRPITPPRRSTPSSRTTCGARGRRGRGGLPRPAFGPRAELSLPHLASANALSVRVPAQLLVSAAGWTRRSSRIRRTRSSASTTSARSRRPRRGTRRSRGSSSRRRGTGAATSLEFEITADSFLRHMVRTLVGTMLERTPERGGGATGRDGRGQRRAPRRRRGACTSKACAIRRSCTAQGS